MIDILTDPRKRFEGMREKAVNLYARLKPSIGFHTHPVEVFVTGNTKDFGYLLGKRVGKMRILTPRDFCEGRRKRKKEY